MKRKTKIVIIVTVAVLLSSLIIAMSEIVPKIYRDWSTEKSNGAHQRSEKVQEVLQQNPDIKEKLESWKNGEIELSEEEVKQIYDTFYKH